MKLLILCAILVTKKQKTRMVDVRIGTEHDGGHSGPCVQIARKFHPFVVDIRNVRDLKCLHRPFFFISSLSSLSTVRVYHKSTTFLPEIIDILTQIQKPILPNFFKIPNFLQLKLNIFGFLYTLAPKIGIQLLQIYYFSW